MVSKPRTLGGAGEGGTYGEGSEKKTRGSTVSGRVECACVKMQERHRCQG